MATTYGKPKSVAGLDADERRAAFVNGLSSSAVVPTAWTAVTFAGTWANTGGVYQTMQYRKVGDYVELRGTIGAGTSGTTAFTLPVGFRPPATIRHIASSNTAFALSTVDINADGTVVVTTGGTTIGINCEFSVST